MDKKQLFFEYVNSEKFLMYAYYLVFEDLPENLTQQQIEQEILDRLLEFTPQELIEYAYLLILLREVDEKGKKHYIQMLRYRHPLEFLDTLSRSKEAQRKNGLKFYLSWKDRLRFKLLPSVLKSLPRKEHRHENISIIKPFITLKTQLESLRQHPKLSSPKLDPYYIQSLSHLENAKKETKRLFGKEAQDFYILFESVFYNSDAVRHHQSFYLSYIVGKNVLDIGAGRGEFVELLQAHGYNAEGIDINQDVVKLATAKGLPIFHADALTFLQKDSSYDTIVAFEVVEHLEPTYLWELLQAIFNALTPGGRVIIETPNPLANTGIGNFYIDLSHVRPLPPQLLGFMMEYIGFCDIQLVFSSPVPMEYATSFMDKNYQTYALIGTKP